MKKIELKDVKPYTAPKHFDMVGLKLHERESVGDPKYWMGMSHFLPGGGAEWAEVPMELVYFVLAGEITVKTKTEKYVLKKWDSIHIMPGDGRAVINETNLPATMLVIM
ncbi:cupin domain-containing protein [Sporomusa aerivorans]|uniref:cupin domain-containing protein n=1 Tax=Sporomusa aerivorans TaxID=204936 RepID=UPI00352B4B05